MKNSMEEMLTFNRTFVANKKYEAYRTSKLPDKKLAILTCMDTRLTELLPAALGLCNGDIKLIKSAGALISHPYGSLMRSLLIAVYMMEVEEIAVIGHYDCGVKGFDPEQILSAMKVRGIPRERIDNLKNQGVDINSWFKGFEDSDESVKQTVISLRLHPLMPQDVLIQGFLIDPTTGKLDRLDPIP